MKKLLLSLVSFMVLSLVALAGEVTHTVRIPLNFSTADGASYYSQSWYDVIQVPSFDTSLGALNRVELKIKQTIQYKFFYENLSNSQGNTITWDRINSKITVKRLGFSKDLAKASYVRGYYSIVSGRVDGVLDWDGTGGHASPLITRNRWGLSTFRTDQSILAYFSQSAVYLDVYGNSRFEFFSYDAWWAMGMHHHSGGELEITYHYI